jgi:hypothetical protein
MEISLIAPDRVARLSAESFNALLAESSRLDEDDQRDATILEVRAKRMELQDAMNADLRDLE